MKRGNDSLRKNHIDSTRRKGMQEHTDQAADQRTVDPDKLEIAPDGQFQFPDH